MDKKLITLLGTGIMGAPMARNIAQVGFSVRVWNRSIAKAEALSDVAEVFETARDAVMSADVVITMLKNGETVTDVLFGENGVASGAKTRALFVDMSSIQPSLARDHAAELEKRGLRHLDAPVSGGEKGATDGTLAIMAGGNGKDYLEATPLFSARLPKRFFWRRKVVAIRRRFARR
jgi:2-hydroxy-3-oxopropionate reductase